MSQSKLPSFSAIKQDVAEAIVKPVADQAGQAFEQGVSMVNGNLAVASSDDKSKTDDPAKPIKSPEEKLKEETQKRNINQFFQQMTAGEQALRQQRQQELITKKQQDAVEVENKKVKVIEDNRKRQMNVAIFQSQRRSEIKKGGE